jgi:hypothetical protein
MSSTILNKMSNLKLHGMLRTYQAMLDSLQHHDLTHDEFINTLIQSEWEDRENKKINRHLRLAPVPLRGQYRRDQLYRQPWPRQNPGLKIG